MSQFATGIFGNLGKYQDTARNFGIVVDIKSCIANTFFELPFKSVFFSEIPESVLVQKRASYNEEVVPGRTEPWLNYSHSEGTIITFTAKLFAQGERKESWTDGLAGTALGLGARFYAPAAPFLGIGGNALSMLLGEDPSSPSPTIFKEVHQKAAFLQSLTYAQYTEQGIAYAPMKVWLVVNDLDWVRGVIKEVNITYKGPYDVDTLMSYQADCYIVFQESNPHPKGCVDVFSLRAPNPRAEADFDWSMAGKSALGTGRSIMGI
jgi:hypothetical protein